jgi:uncharacterized membrane protein
MTYKQAGQIAFGTGMISLGVVTLVFGDFAQVWRSSPTWLPGRHFLAYASAVLMLVCGVGLLWKRTEVAASGVLLYYWALIVLLTQLPVVIKHPLIEVAWQGIAHLTMLLTGAWMLFTADTRAVRITRVLFGLALIPIGLAHFVYLELTTPLVPGWLPYHTFWAYFTGAAQIAAAAGVLLGVYARLAVALDAALMAAFTFLVWPQLLVASPAKPGLWSEFAISWAMTAAAWVVAASITNGSRVTAAWAPAEGERSSVPSA